LYYDTEEFKCYWEKIEGLKFRKKIRIRRYVTDEPFDENSFVFVEIKQRIDRVTQKKRVGMSYKEARLLLDEEIMPEKFRPQDLPVLEELLSMVKEDDLRPAAITTYNRQAFF
jgi:SPX domain protein involved in polyphosphate accumulation